MDAIISVGYRVNSKRGVRFRQWATRILREHLVRGFTLSQQRLAERGIREAQQTMFGNPLYRTREEKAAHLLYLTQESIAHRLNPQALTALTLLIAESSPTDKDLMIRLITNLLAVPEE